MSVLKSPVQYFGAKQQIAEQLVALMPAHMGYIEPYAGSLSVLLAKPESKIEVVNDLDARLMTFWRVLRDRPDELLHVAEFTPHSREELERAAALDADTDLELARQVWVLLTQGRSRTMKRTGWRYYVDPRGTNGSFSTYMRAYRSRLLPTAERLQNVSLENRPALEVIARWLQRFERATPPSCSRGTPRTCTTSCSVTGTRSRSAPDPTTRSTAMSWRSSGPIAPWVTSSGTREVCREQADQGDPRCGVSP